MSDEHVDIDDLSPRGKLIAFLLMQLGVPTILLGLMCYGTYSFAVWGAVNIAQPVIERHCKHLEHLEAMLDRQTGVMVSIEKQLNAHSTLLEDLTHEMKTAPK